MVSSADSRMFYPFLGTISDQCTALLSPRCLFGVVTAQTSMTTHLARGCPLVTCWGLMAHGPSHSLVSVESIRDSVVAE